MFLVAAGAGTWRLANPGPHPQAVAPRKSLTCRAYFEIQATLTAKRATSQSVDSQLGSLQQCLLVWADFFWAGLENRHYRVFLWELKGLFLGRRGGEIECSNYGLSRFVQVWKKRYMNQKLIRRPKRGKAQFKHAYESR